MTETIVSLLTELLAALTVVTENQAKSLSLLGRMHAHEMKRRAPGRPRLNKEVLRPDVVNYGDWDSREIEGLFGDGTRCKDWGPMCWNADYNAVRGCTTTLYHEFTRWLLENPRNRNFWQTGNHVEVYAKGRLRRQNMSEFTKNHSSVLKAAFHEFVVTRRMDLKNEATRVHGPSRGAEFVTHLVKYVNREHFANPHDDVAYSNQVCKISLKALRRYHST